MNFITAAYDTDRPEEQKESKSQYTSKKEMLTIIAILIVLGFASIPLFNNMKDDRDKTVCATNIKSIYQAMIQYAELNSDQLPPIYHMGENGAPYLAEPNNRPIVWATLIQPYMSRGAKFFCPASEEEERMFAVGLDGDFELTYGMYLPMSTKPHLRLSRPSETVIFSETSNNGAVGSYNPTPFLDSSGEVVPFDAFMIGFNNSNFGFDDDSNWVTRLAVRGATDGYSSAGVTTRHKAGIYVMFADGHKQMIKAADAEVENLYPNLKGLWGDN